MSEFSRFPAPVDDGGAAGLEGKRLPGIELASTSGSTVDLSRVGGTLVLYVYPHATGTPDMPAPGWADRDALGSLRRRHLRDVQPG